jgi:hypothetical protein
MSDPNHIDFHCTILDQRRQAANKIFAIYIAEKYLFLLNAPIHDMVQHSRGI